MADLPDPCTVTDPDVVVDRAPDGVPFIECRYCGLGAWGEHDATCAWAIAWQVPLDLASGLRRAKGPLGGHALSGG